MVTSVYIVSAKSYSYIGYYTGGSVKSLLDHEWEGIPVELIYWHSTDEAPSIIESLRDKYKNITITSTMSDKFGFTTKLLDKQTLNNIIRSMNGTDENGRGSVLRTVLCNDYYRCYDRMGRVYYVSEPTGYYIINN